LIRVGTRGSALALAQAGWVAERLGDETELVVVASDGETGDKSRWVSGLERALLEDRIDVAVHSAKDVPAELADGLALVAIPEREDPRDAICGARGLAELPDGARVGTSSLRRAAQLRAAREGLQVVDVRGNVDTRLRKLTDGQCEALVLAAAGLRRLGREPDGVLDELVPAAGQGALALEARSGDEHVRTCSQRVDDPKAGACVLAERELTRRLEASCNTPVGAHAQLVGDGRLELRAWVGRGDGSAWISDHLIGKPEGLGTAVAERMLAAGAGEMLR
jgi:hydroxymethylbilane synthase